MGERDSLKSSGYPTGIGFCPVLGYRVPRSGYYSVYAVGKCSSGEETRISNQLSVFSYIQSSAEATCTSNGGSCVTGVNCCSGACEGTCVDTN